MDLVGYALRLVMAAFAFAGLVGMLIHLSGLYFAIHAIAIVILIMLCALALFLAGSAFGKALWLMFFGFILVYGSALYIFLQKGLMLTLLSVVACIIGLMYSRKKKKSSPIPQPVEEYHVEEEPKKQKKKKPATRAG